ncbi:major facilitator superfamily domain-containing protein 6-like [Hydractinia symbiolongicarpus]|uniref:major facilitator superfamily domain-containing protein 6-like n=1 Tax=Hydractinia symbiolongicarpus TaxID=13093 RepID=UPI00254AF6D0|nr:major facilitator superfamily domain-containing protein 6-like [Hydractinia symbiolongicarpus]
MNIETDTTKSNKARPQSRVIIALIPAKICYFAINGSLACFLPYLTVFLYSVGLSITQCGIILGTRTVFSLLIIPCLGVIADRFRRKKLILLTLITLTAAVAVPLPWVAKAANANLKVENSGGEKLFFAMFFMLSLSAIFGIAAVGFIDSATMHLVKKYEGEATFGYQRVFGAAGFVTLSFLAGFLSDRFQIKGVSKYAVAFLLDFPILFTAFVAVIFLDQSVHEIGKNETKYTPTQILKVRKERRKIKVDENKIYLTFEDNKEKENCPIVPKEHKTSVIKTVLTTCWQFKVIFFFIITAHMGINFSLINGFQAIFMEKEIGTTKTVIGIATALSPVSEILAFPVSAKLIKLFGGTYPSIIIATFSYCLRFLFMSFVVEQYLMLPIQFLQFFGFAIFWAAAVEHTNHISPMKISVTMFSIITSLYYSLGNIIASIVGGIIYDKYGGRWLFRISSINCAFMTCSIILYFFLYERKNTNKLKAEDIKGILNKAAVVNEEPEQKMATEV